MSRVFIVHQPMRIDDRTHRWKRAVDLSPAAEYGELHFLLDTPERPPLDPEASLPILRRKLASFTRDDYIVMAGDMNLIAYACVLAAEASEGYLRLLRWDPRDKRYIALPAQVTQPNMIYRVRSPVAETVIETSKMLRTRA